MIAGFIAKYALAALAALLALSLLALGVQSYRLKSLEASVAEDAAAASEEARKKYAEQAIQFNTVAANLVHVQQERDNAFKELDRKAAAYIRRPAAAVQCMDDDGMRLITEYARGKPASASAPAGAVPERAANAD